MDDLIAKLEAATEGSHWLDRLIDEALGGDFDKPHSFTTSIDAALKLVPEGKAWGVGSIMFDELPPRRAFAANCRREGCITPDTPAYDAVGATPALALCIAALRARQEKEKPNG